MGAGRFLSPRPAIADFANASACRSNNNAAQSSACGFCRIFVRPGLATGQVSQSRTSCDTEGAVDHLDEVALLAKDEPSGLRHFEVRSRLRIRFQTRPIYFVGGQAFECDQPPGNIVRALPGEKVTHDMSAAARDDLPPIFSVVAKCLLLKRVNLVSDKAGNLHLGILLAHHADVRWSGGNDWETGRCDQ